MDRLDGFVLVLEGAPGIQVNADPDRREQRELQVYAAGSPRRIQTGYEHF